MLEVLHKRISGQKENKGTKSYIVMLTQQKKAHMINTVRSESRCVLINGV
jgi:phosphoribosyl-ATP pyrophosphohydrolase